MTEEIPDEFEQLLSDTLTREGIEQAWGAKWRLLNGRRMCEVWPHEPDRCREAIAAYVDGAYL